MRKHTCREVTDCTCYHAAMEPEDSCPVHGDGKAQPRCAVCGRFMPRRAREDREDDPDSVD